MKKINLQLSRFLGVALTGAVMISGCGGGGDGGTQNVNDAPTISGSAVPFVQATTPYDFKPAASDANGDMLTFSVKNLPAWASFDVQTGELSGQPDETQIGQYNDITISVSDGTDTVNLASFSIAVLNPPLRRQSIGTDNATVTPTADGFDATGDVSVTSGGNTTELKNANLQFQFDAGDNLTGVTGTALLPNSISDYLLIPNPLTVKVGMFTGTQINNDPDIGVDSTGGIRLVDSRQYLVFFLGAEMNITVQNKNNSSQVPITLGLGEAQSLIIMDPTDPFSYVFGYQNGLGFGTGFSLHGLLPYVPKFADNGPDAYPQLDSFYGNEVDKGVFPLGFKIFDLFSLSGTRVVNNPNLFDIDWNNPLDAKLRYRAGFNGAADFNFAVLGIGLFSYHLADMSATVDVGAQRQHVAVQGVYAPTESSQPVWLPARPSPTPTDKLVANLYVDGNNGYAMDLRGQYQSDFPPANLNGSMHLDKNGLTLNGIIDDATNPITVSATATASSFDAKVNYKVDITADLQTRVLNDMDKLTGQVQSAINDYTNAITGYNLAVSLDGLRAQLPAIADTAITTLNAIPEDIYQTVYNSVYNYLTASTSKYCKDITVPDPTFSDPFNTKMITPCFAYKDYVNEVSVATSIATSARTYAQSYIATYITNLETMKQYASQADDATIRAALKSALLTAYDNRTININYSYAYKKSISGNYTYLLVDYPWSGTISKTFTVNKSFAVLTPAQADMLKTAADNVDKIPGAYTVMIDTQTIVNSLPTESAISQVRQEVQSGVAQVPTFGGAGYHAGMDVTRTAYVILNDKPVEVTFNLLDPATAADDILRLITQTTINQASANLH